MGILNSKQVATPDPALVPDAYLRQILQALRHNQIELFKALGTSSSTTAATTTAIPKAAKLPVRSAGNAEMQASTVNITLPADAVAANPASIATLANANKVAINLLSDEYNKLRGDVAALVAIVKNVQAQQAEIINRLNQGITP